MKFLFNLFLFIILLAGCSAVSTPENAAPVVLPMGTPGSVNPIEASPTEVSQTKIYPTEASQTKIFPTEASPLETAMNDVTPNSKPNVITVKPPMLPVEPVPNSSAGWQTFTSKALGVTVDYPGDWTAIEQDGAVTFTSPQGATIKLQLITMNANTPAPQNQQCATLINAYGLSVDTCVDTSTLFYSAKFSIQSDIGITQQLLLSTTNTDALDVYTQMLNTMRLNH